MKGHAFIKWAGSVVVLAALAAGVFFIAQPKVEAPVKAQTVQQAYQTVKVQRGDLTATIGVTGTVRSSQTAILPWQVTGVVQTVPVKKGDLVKADQVLASLDPTSLPQQVILAQASLSAAQDNLENLMSTNQVRANAELALARAQKAYDDAKKARDNKQYQRASQETIDIAQANLVLANHALDDATTIFNRNKNRSSDDVVFASALSQLAAAQQRYDAAKYNLDYVSALPDPIDVQTADALVDVAQANLLAARLEWERDKDGPSDRDIAAARAQVNAAQAALNQARLAAPFDGTVTVANSKVGDQVTPGTVGFEIDDLSHLYVDVEVPEADIAQVKTGNRVSIQFDANPGKVYRGTVTDISDIGRNISGTVNFTVTFEINDKDKVIKPGMTVSAEITTSLLKGVLLVPSRAVRNIGGASVLYLLKNGIPTPVTIRKGPESGGSVQIAAGQVSEGDLAVLNPAVQP